MTKKEILDDIRCLQTRATSIAHKVQCLDVLDDEQKEFAGEIKKLNETIDIQNDYIKLLKDTKEEAYVYKKALEICCKEESKFRERVLVGNERLSKYYFRVEIKPEEYIALAKEDNL